MLPNTSPNIGIAFSVLSTCEALSEYFDIHHQVFGAYPPCACVTEELHLHLWNEHVTESYRQQYNNVKPEMIFLGGSAVFVNPVLEKAWEKELITAMPGSSSVN